MVQVEIHILSTGASLNEEVTKGLRLRFSDAELKGVIEQEKKYTVLVGQTNIFTLLGIAGN